jgi:hypothetical protein
VERLVTDGHIRSPAQGQFYLAISHDCDLTNPSFEVEPSAELLRATVLSPSEKEGSWMWGKNPRIYHLEWKSPDGKRICEFSIQDRCLVPRRHFASAVPDPDIALDAEDIRALALWLARRYVRSAFPDTFVERTKPATNSLRKSLKRAGNLLTGVFVFVEDHELPDHTPYRILLHGSMRVEDFDVPEKRKQAQELLDKIEAALGDCDGVEVLESNLRSEDEITLDDRRRLKRWDFDDLTVRGRAVSELPPDD